MNIDEGWRRLETVAFYAGAILWIIYSLFTWIDFDSTSYKGAKFYVTKEPPRWVPVDRVWDGITGIAMFFGPWILLIVVKYIYDGFRYDQPVDSPPGPPVEDEIRDKNIEQEQEIPAIADRGESGAVAAQKGVGNGADDQQGMRIDWKVIFIGWIVGTLIWQLIKLL